MSIIHEFPENANNSKIILENIYPLKTRSPEKIGDQKLSSSFKNLRNISKNIVERKKQLKQVDQEIIDTAEKLSPPSRDKPRCITYK